MKSLHALVLFAFLGNVSTFASASPRPQAEETPKIPSIEVSDTATVYVDPDIAEVTLGIRAEGKTAMEAQVKANLVAKEIFDRVTKLGISKELIGTGELTLEIQEDDDSSRPPKTHPAIYQATNTVTIRVLNLDKVSAVVDESLVAGANKVRGVRFGLIDDDPARQQALTVAITRARSKAETMAKALNVRLGDILDVHEANGRDYSLADVSVSRLEKRKAIPTTISPGQITVSLSVVITYRIIQ